MSETTAEQQAPADARPAGRTSPGGAPGAGRYVARAQPAVPRNSSPLGRFLARAAALTAVLTAAGSLCGLLRDQTIAHLFGAGSDTDAFLVAWTVPEVAATLLIEDAMALLLVPAFSLALSARAARPAEGADRAAARRRPRPRMGPADRHVPAAVLRAGRWLRAPRARRSAAGAGAGAGPRRPGRGRRLHPADRADRPHLRRRRLLQRRAARPPQLHGARRHLHRLQPLHHRHDADAARRMGRAGRGRRGGARRGGDGSPPAPLLRPPAAVPQDAAAASARAAAKRAALLGFGLLAPGRLLRARPAGAGARRTVPGLLAAGRRHLASELRAEGRADADGVLADDLHRHLPGGGPRGRRGPRRAGQAPGGTRSDARGPGGAAGHGVRHRLRAADHRGPLPARRVHRRGHRRHRVGDAGVRARSARAQPGGGAHPAVLLRGQADLVPGGRRWRPGCSSPS